MKYANINIETIGIVNREDKAHINIGDHLQNIIIKDLYESMGIAKEEIYELDFNEITSYDGEYLILPINQAISRGLNKFLSNKIIPVVLGISRDSSAITNDEIEYYKQYSPIGCRDNATFNALKEKNVDCYLNGCITCTLSKRNSTPANAKPYIIEATNFALDAMPESIKSNAVFLENAFYGKPDDLFPSGMLEPFIRERYELLKKNASVVITSRMHVASPCMGMGIPVILVRDKIDYRFSWIDKYIPVYSPKTSAEIDWNPQPVDLELNKKIIIEYAKKRIRDTYEKYKDRLEISDIYELRKKREYDLPQFSKGVIEFVNKKWDTEDYFNFSIWGENDASERLLQYIKDHYPNAKYLNFYDSYKTIEYYGRKAKHPNEIVESNDEFIFVTGYTATDAAKELFNKIGKSEDSYYLFGKVVRGY